jgi:hypothetical protein
MGTSTEISTVLLTDDSTGIAIKAQWKEARREQRVETTSKVPRTSLVKLTAVEFPSSWHRRFRPRQLNSLPKVLS